MNEPDKHHYLPVFYLSRWSQPDGKVIRYYRPHQAVVASPIAPKNTGYDHAIQLNQKISIVRKIQLQ